MTSLPIRTVTVTIDAPYPEVADYLADPSMAHEWGTEFFAGPLRRADGDEWVAPVPMMGGECRYRQEVDVRRGILDIFLAPPGGEFGPPLPVRLLRNGDGIDVLWTLTRFPGTPDEAWQHMIESMERELQNLKLRFEG